MASEPKDPSSTNGRITRRAAVVCFRCHEKKIRCDRETRAGEEPQCCKNCTNSGSSCRLRPSKRGTGKRRARPIDASILSDQITERSADQTSPSPNVPDGKSHTSNSFLSRYVVQDFATNNGSGLSRQSLPESQQHPYGPQTSHSASGARQPFSARVERPTATPSRESTSSQQLQRQPSYLGDTGYMQIFSHDSGGDAATSPDQITVERTDPLDIIPPALQESYADTYFEYARVWCPVLDKDTLLTQPEVADSFLLKHSLALCGSRIKPPLTQHESASVHYNRAKGLFYANYESNPIIRISSLMLFYWWSAGSPNVVSMDTNWWWTGTAIRLAQEIGLHREPHPGQTMRAGETPGLRRRIWWTLFARERLTAVSQGRPCIIDPDYCDVRMVSLDDFPDADYKAEILIAWVRLCEILGRIGKHLLRKVGGHESTISLARELINWVQSLPAHLQLPVGKDRTSSYDRDVHGLHLTYLTTLALLHLSKSSQPLPKASIPALVAASCIARVFEDYLARGSVRFLAGQAGWYITVAILALLHARRVEGLATYANADIRTLRGALKQIAVLWHSAKMFDLGFDRLLGTDLTTIPSPQNPISNGDFSHPVPSPTINELATGDGVNWMDYFPYITSETSPLIGALLANNIAMPFSELEWPLDITTQLHEFFARPDEFSFSSDLFHM